ncbi:hypothetical protein GCM10010277_85500 [Streptomyces longisporoflavus]|nr:hypothetical protein [Streptomyces longisporoflavus]GGV72474.1 hypothetical protein GCM10010277_85500 [Streptomyces longisporoflavus]
MRAERRDTQARRSAADGLAEHLRSVLWGPAEFVGVPGRLLAEGVLAGTVAAAAIVGSAFAGMWGGPRGLVTGELGVVVVAALVLYLMVLRAGRVLIGLVAVLGACLSFMAPDVAAGVVLQHRGLVEPARVASVQTTTEHGRTVCSVEGVGAVRAGAEVWRGCAASIAPGDTLPVVYDPRGRVPARGVAAPGELVKAELWLAALAIVFVGVCTVAVVRSFRLEATGHGA